MFKNLPQKKYGSTILKFKDIIICELSVLLNGFNKDNLTKEQEKFAKLSECSLAIWPPVSKTCEVCILKNTPDRFLEDKKGRRVRVIK
jgi:hypothetical protein